MSECLPLPTTCGSLDRGGGVYLPSTNTFLVYTIKPLPPSLFPPTCDKLLLSGLEAQAEEVARAVPIYLDATGLEEELETISSPPSSLQSLGAIERDGGRDRHAKKNGIPPFIINASRSAHIAIAGSSSNLKTLLSVLRRPWCVLELSLTSDAAVSELCRFSLMAHELDPEGYAHAADILRHEEACRTRRLDFSGDMVYGGNRIAMETIRGFYMALFQTSEMSFMGFWVRAICVSAKVLGVGFSAFMWTVAGMSRNDDGDGAQFVIDIYRKVLRVLSTAVDGSMGYIGSADWRMLMESWKRVEMRKPPGKEGKDFGAFFHARNSILPP